MIWESNNLGEKPNYLGNNFRGLKKTLLKVRGQPKSYEKLNNKENNYNSPICCSLFCLNVLNIDDTKHNMYII